MEEPDINVTRLAVASQDASKSPYAKPAPPLVCPAWPRAPVPPPMASECAQGPGLPATSALPSPGSPSCLQVTPPEGGSSLPPTGTSVLPSGLAGCGPQVSSPPWLQPSVLTSRPVSPPAASGAWTLPSEQLPQTAPGTELGAAPGGHIGVSPRLSGGAGVTSHVSPEYRWLHPPRLGRERRALKGKTRRRPGGALPVAH